MAELTFCKTCPMDGSDPNISYENGVCNHCRNAQKEIALAKSLRHTLPLIVDRVKSDGVAGQYDCLIGLSGGVDSSTVLHHAVKLGLRPLCFTMDNGWNDPKADENVMRLIETLKVPLYRYVINLERFKELQAAYMKAGVINVEAATDHMLMAATYETAAKHGIKWILSGGNVATESVMPAAWSYPARDLWNLKDIYRSVWHRELKGLPTCGILKYNWYRWVKGIKTLYLLDYFDYNRNEAFKVLAEVYGYKEYGKKHEESVFTAWFQNYYLFQKFGIDKRKAHFSSLVNSGQMTRAEAMELLAEPPQFTPLGFEARVMKYPKRRHEDFMTDTWLWGFLGKIVKTIRNAAPSRLHYLGA